MRFYLLGIEEWLEYPNPTGIELFKKESKVHWKPVDQKLRKITKNDLISYMHEFCYEYRRVPEDKRKMSLTSFDGFSRAIHDLTSPYEKRKKIRIEEE